MCGCRFVATPNAVKLDNGLGARLRDVVSGTPDTMKQSEDDRHVSAAISQILVDESHALGFISILLTILG